MNWWGKLIGGSFGFMMGGPLGAIMGAALGHHFDKGLDNLDHYHIGDTERTQAAFFTATFSIMGHLAKADGHVSQNEINIAQQVMNQMQLTADQKKAAIKLFDEGKQENFPIDEIVEQFRKECHRRRNLMQMFLEILISTALADGVLHSNEKKILNDISNQLGFNRGFLDQLISMVNAQQHYSHQQNTLKPKTTLKDAYTVLGVASNATDAEIKRAYRRQISQHHPDKLVAKGLPEEMIKIANEKTHEIKAAYEQIKASRKL